MFGNHAAGIYEKAFDPQISWPERLERAGRFGFDYLEISIDETDMRLARLEWSKEQRLELVGIMKEVLVLLLRWYRKKIQTLFQMI